MADKRKKVRKHSKNYAWKKRRLMRETSQRKEPQVVNTDVPNSRLLRGEDISELDNMTQSIISKTMQVAEDGEATDDCQMEPGVEEHHISGDSGFGFDISEEMVYNLDRSTSVDPPEDTSQCHNGYPKSHINGDMDTFSNESVDIFCANSAGAVYSTESSIPSEQQQNLFDYWSDASSDKADDVPSWNDAFPNETDDNDIWSDACSDEPENIDIWSDASSNTSGMETSERRAEFRDEPQSTMKQTKKEKCNKRRVNKKENRTERKRYSNKEAEEIEKQFTDEYVSDGNLKGRVIFDPRHFFITFMGYLNYHWLQCPLKEPFKHLRLIKASAQGMREMYTWTCTGCNFIFKVISDKAHNNTALHDAIVSGTMTAGAGYNAMREILASMNVLCMSDKTYRLTRKHLAKTVVDVSKASIREAVSEEIRLAREAGDVIDGIPFITVIVDGAWSKRSYKGGRYDALSGVAVIIGKRTGRVLYIGTRNKYCKHCEVANKNSSEPGPCGPECAKNYSRNDASTLMEADILLEGFKESVKENGLIYRYIIGDGDSSVYSAICNFRPYAQYGVRVEKIECINHLYRRFSKHIQEISDFSIANGLLPHGTVLRFRTRVKDSGAKIRKLIEASVDDWIEKDLSEEAKIVGLSADIPNIIYHHFGHHFQCPSRGAECDNTQPDIMPELDKVGWRIPLLEAGKRLQTNAKSLLLRMTTNAAEGVHSIGNKVLGGRRVNHSASNDYTLRQYCAAVQFNSHDALSKLHEECGTIPQAVTTMEEGKEQQAARTARSRAEHHRIRHRGGRGEDNNYGMNADQADLTEEECNTRKALILGTLKENQRNRLEIERETIQQNESSLWHRCRENMLTASNFGPVCKMQPRTSCISMVRRILYSGAIHNEHINFGKANEAKALKDLAAMIQKVIRPCGLYIDEVEPYLGASPDGEIEEDGCVEVKCLSSARDLTPEEAIKKKPHNRIFKSDGQMNPNHNYYYQVQGQLHITQRRYCIFAIWTPLGIKSTRVERDDDFWATKMEPKLKRFYLQCILRELVDKKIYRKKLSDFQEPDYIQEARQRYEESMNTKQKSNENHGKRREPCSGSEVEPEGGAMDPEFPGESGGNEQRPFENEEGEPAFHVINDGTHIHTQEEFDAMVELGISTIEKADALRTIIDPDRKLDSDAINYFLKVLKGCTPDIEVFWTSYFPYPQYTQPSQTKRDLHIIGGNREQHWMCLYFDEDKLALYDSLNQGGLGIEESTYIKNRYPDHAHTLKKIPITQQPDLISCGIYAIAIATSLPRKQDPAVLKYSLKVHDMRECARWIIEHQQLTDFPHN